VLWAEPPTVSPDALVAAIEALSPQGALRGVATRVAAQCSVTLRLPARRGTPLPSPELAALSGAAARSSRGRVGLKRFCVPAVRLTGTDTLDALVALGDDDTGRVGASARVLAQIAELALEVVAGGRVVPTLERGEAHHLARWAALRTPRDSERLALLSGALPRAAVALEGSGDAQAVVPHALDAMVDALCREAWASPAPARPGRRSSASPTTRSSGPPREPAEVWLAALRSPDGRVDAGPEALAALELDLEKWRSPLNAPGSSWRLCLRLHEPPADAAPTGMEGGPESAPRSAEGPWVRPDPGASWRVEFLLQAVDEPTLLVEAAEVWRSGESLRRAARTVEQPHEVLLAELGRAVRAFGELDRALAEPAPTHLELDLDGAYRFLAEAAPSLELAGFGVLVPSWWREPTVRLGLRVRAGASAWAPGRGLSAQGLCTFDWEAALGDTPLTLAELQDLAQLKTPLVRAHGQWTELDPGEVRQLAAFLSGGRGARQATLADVLRAAAGAPMPGAGVPILAVDAEGEIGSLVRGELAEHLAVVSTPEGFAGELRPYQRRAVGWIRLLERMGLGACLADDMGLGKTATVLGVLQSDLVEGVASGPTLVVCPTSVVGNWRQETERFTPQLRVVVHHGTGRAGGDILRELAADADVMVTTYPLVERDRVALSSVEWGRIVLDEAQQVKNPRTRTAQAVRAIAAPRRLALTGTPVENHLGELWSIMEVLNPGLLGSEHSFREQFVVPIERYGDEDAAERLRMITRPVVLRRIKSDRAVAADLPAKVETKEQCPLTREQATLYQAVVGEMLEKIAGSDGIERKGLVLATLLRLKQVCNHPAQYAADGSPLAGRSGKLERTVEVLDQVLESKERAIVFTQFAQMGVLLQRHLTQRLGRRVGLLHGGVPRAVRDELVATFQSPEGLTPVMILSLRAGGTGLNLTAASHVLHYDRWWNPAVEDQATDRAYRIGQHREVRVRKLVCAGTVEDRIDTVIESKRDLAGRIVGTGEEWLAALSTDELADVLALSPEAVP
jgi:superfamily II DNA or RNA helicase